MLSVVATHDNATEPGSIPAAAMAACCELTSWRSGSSAQAWLAGMAGVVDAPFTHNGEEPSARR